MDSSEEKITFDNLPQAVATLLREVRELHSQIDTLSSCSADSPWMDVEDLCEYLPGHPAKCTVYAWCAHENIPHHFCGKALCFYRPEIDHWMMKE